MVYSILNKYKTKILNLLLAVTMVLAVSSCSQWVMSDRQKVVFAAHEALCKENDFKAMRPFVSKNSLSVLDLTSVITNIGQAFVGSPISDRIAVECHAGQQNFVDEIKVNDQRFIVRTKNPGSEEIIETVMLLEDGVWKIALLGR